MASDDILLHRLFKLQAIGPCDHLENSEQDGWIVSKKIQR
jgi:hypothetical protein